MANIVPLRKRGWEGREGELFKLPGVLKLDIYIYIYSKSKVKDLIFSSSPISLD